MASRVLFCPLAEKYLYHRICACSGDSWHDWFFSLSSLSFHFFLIFLFSVALLGSPAGGIQNSIGSVGTGQQSTPALSNPNPIDPSSMQRAYAALGLPYGNQPQTQLQPQVQGQQPAQPQAHQQMRTINALGKWRKDQEKKKELK